MNQVPDLLLEKPPTLPDFTTMIWPKGIAPPTNPALLATCKEIYQSQAYNTRKPIQEYCEASNAGNNLNNCLSDDQLMVASVEMCMKKLLKEANKISKTWVSELYVLLLRVGILFEEDCYFSTLQRKSLDATLRPILDKIMKMEIENITSVDRDFLTAIVHHLELSKM